MQHHWFYNGSSSVPITILLTFAPFMQNLLFCNVSGALALTILLTFAPFMQHLSFYIGFWTLPLRIPVTFALLDINIWDAQYFFAKKAKSHENILKNNVSNAGPELLMLGSVPFKGGYHPCKCRHFTSKTYSFTMCLATPPPPSFKHSTLFEVGVHDPSSIRHFLQLEFTVLVTVVTS